MLKLVVYAVMAWNPSNAEERFQKAYEIEKEALQQVIRLKKKGWKVFSGTMVRQ